jgi:N-acetylglucosaminyl-diphospho-decaprenol L-rhamnosyltransferase
VSQRIDVVVLAYNRYELTESCLRHLRAQTIEHRVIVVDNGSTDATRACLHRDWPDVTVVELDCNHRFTEAVNLGVRIGDGDNVVLLNNDVKLRSDCLERLVKPLELDDRVGSVAMLLLQADERSVDSVGVTVDVTLAGFQRLHGLPIERARDRRPLLTGPEGTAAAYRRLAWEQVGGLDEAIDAYMEILDLALRLRDAGWETTCTPDAVGVHLGSATFGRGSRVQRRLSGFSRGYLLRRYGVLRGSAAPRALLTEGIVVAGDALISRDLTALRARLAGWRAGAGHERRPQPSPRALDTEITFWDSLALRRGAYRSP